MRNLKKKAAAIACAAAFLTCLTPSAAFAEGNETPVEIMYGITEDDKGIAPYTNDHPTETRSIANNKYEFSGQCNGTASLYTNYMFYGVSSMVIHVNNKGNKSLTVKLEHCGDIFHTIVHTFTVPANSTKIETVSVNSKDNYCLKFSCPSNFDGYVF